jgi:sulfide:quinone oxidoreductase
MKNLVILGAGTSGTMMANHLVSNLPKQDWKITIVDQYKTHYYQPGFLFLPFDIYTEDQVKKNGHKFIPKGVTYIQKRIEQINAESNTIDLEDETLNYDILIVATGSKIAPDEVEGMNEEGWHKNVFDFYTYEGAKALRDKLRTWEGGKMVVHITEMPIKCPVAPLEFAFLADSYFNKKGMRDKVDITYVTPLGGAFTKPKATEALHYLLEEKNIKEVTDFAIERVDNENQKIIDYADTEVEYDLLVTVPTNMGDEVIERSGLGDDLNFIPTHKHTLQSEAHENIFVIGDATNLPASKAGSVAHFQAETLTDNILLYIAGQPLKEEFDGHANCFIETGNNKALLIDFNYTHEPVEGTFPIAGIGPLKLLKESVFNHWGKLAFRWIYWNMLLKGIPIPFVGRNMSKKGKQF